MAVWGEVSVSTGGSGVGIFFPEDEDEDENGDGDGDDDDDDEDENEDENEDEGQVVSRVGMPCASRELVDVWASSLGFKFRSADNGVPDRLN